MQTGGGVIPLFYGLEKEDKMKRGFATSAILYTMLLLFIILLVNILSNLQNKKTILDTLKKETINALQQDTIIDSILEQIIMINNKIVDLNTRITDYESNTYTKTEIDNTVTTILNQITNITKNMYTKEQVDSSIDRQKIRSIYIAPSEDPEVRLYEVLDEEYERIAADYTCSNMFLVLTRHTTYLPSAVWLVETCSINYNGGIGGLQSVKAHTINGFIYKTRAHEVGEWGEWVDIYINN